MHCEAIRHVKHIDLFPIKFTGTLKTSYILMIVRRCGVRLIFCFIIALWKWLNSWCFFDQVTAFVFVFFFSFWINHNEFNKTKRWEKKRTKITVTSIFTLMHMNLMGNFKLAVANALNKPLIMSTCQNANDYNKELFTDSFFFGAIGLFEVFFFIIFCLHDLTECKRLNANDLLTDNSMVISSFVKSFEPCHSIVHSFSVNTLSNT